MTRKSMASQIAEAKASTQAATAEDAAKRLERGLELNVSERAALKAMWPGKAIFTSAFLTTLPRTATTKPATFGPAKKHRVAPIAPVRRGQTVRYERGPLWHKPGKRGANWTNYMVATILAHTDTASAEQAHRESGQYADKRLDFNWMFKQLFITRVQ